MPQTLKSEARDLGRILGATLARIEAGDLTARPETRYRIEGALVVCRILAGDEPDLIVEEFLAEML